MVSRYLGRAETLFAALISHAKMSGNATRDLRIDFFRGIALYMIIVDHVPGDPLSYFTYGRLGFSDAAEIFVFLSGVVCGIVYLRKLLDQGPRGLLKAVFSRTLKIYCYYALASVATILLIAVSRDLIAVPDNHQAYITLHEAPLTAASSAVLFFYPPELLTFLILYLKLTLLVVPLFLLISVFSRRLALISSGAIWLLAQIYPNFLPQGGSSGVNLLGWQFLFCIGMFLGICDDCDTTSFPKYTSVAAWTIICIGLAHEVVIFLVYYLGFDLGLVGEYNEIFRYMVHVMGETLPPIRLLHFLSVAFIVATYMKPNSPVLTWPGASTIIRTGRCSIQVFSIGAVLSVLFNLFVAVGKPSILERIVLDCAVILFIASISTVLTRSHPVRRQVLGPRPAVTGDIEAVTRANMRRADST